MEIKSIRLAAGLTQKGFGEFFGIPKRTIEDWESGRRKPPKYLIDLLLYKLKKENFLA